MILGLSKSFALAGKSFLFIAFIVYSGAGGTAFAQNEKVFFGNLHSHTSYSDGSGTPEDAYNHARFAAGLDFLAITEHNHKDAENGAGDRKDGVLIATNPALYNGAGPQSLISAANRLTVNGAFVALYGQEFSSISKGNHINILDVPHVIDVPNGRFDSLLKVWLPAHLDSRGKKGIVQLNHPALFDDDSKEYGADDFGPREVWIKNLDSCAYLIEILNGPAMTRTGGQKPSDRGEADFLHYLNLGFHLAPTADQDNHYFTWGTATNARTAVIADELTKEKLLNALESRHVYATEDPNLKVLFRVNGRLCGDRISPPPAKGSELAIDFTIQDADEPAASYKIEIFSDTIGGEPARIAIEEIEVENNTPPGGAVSIADIKYEGGFQYLFFKISQQSEDGPPDLLWTAPVWLEPAGSPPVAENVSELAASKKSKRYHVSLRCKDAKRIKAGNLIRGEAARQGRQKHPGCPRL